MKNMLEPRYNNIIKNKQRLGKDMTQNTFSKNVHHSSTAFASAPYYTPNSSFALPLLLSFSPSPPYSISASHPIVHF